MTVDVQTTRSKTGLYTGYTFAALSILFLVMDACLKFTRNPKVVEAQTQLGFPLHLTPGIGAVALICTALYAVPSTSVLGALLLTGYLGGAVALHLRVDNPLFSHILFPVYVGLFVWAGIWLREDRLRSLFPVRKRMDTQHESKKLVRTGYVLTILSGLLIFLTAAIKFLYVPPAGSPSPIFPLHHMHLLGFLEIAIAVLYLIPATSFLGAVLMAGYLGGATAVNLCAGESIGASIIPVAIAVLAWVGLWLRDRRVRHLLPVR